METSGGGSGGGGAAAAAPGDGAGGERAEGNVQREEQEWPRGFLPVEKGTAFVVQRQAVQPSSSFFSFAPLFLCCFCDSRYWCVICHTMLADGSLYLLTRQGVFGINIVCLNECERSARKSNRGIKLLCGGAATETLFFLVPLCLEM